MADTVPTIQDTLNNIGNTGEISCAAAFCESNSASAILVEPNPMGNRSHEMEEKDVMHVRQTEEEELFTRAEGNEHLIDTTANSRPRACEEERINLESVMVDVGERTTMESEIRGEEKAEPMEEIINERNSEVGFENVSDIHGNSLPNEQDSQR